MPSAFAGENHHKHELPPMQNQSNFAVISRRCSHALCVAAIALLYACGGGPGPHPVEPVQISVAPVSSTAVSGGAATFSVAVSGSGLSFQWQLSIDQGSTWADITGANASQYTIAAVQPALDGNRYRVVVSGGGSSVTSDPVTLTVQAAPAPLTMDQAVSLMRLVDRSYPLFAEAFVVPFFATNEAGELFIAPSSACVSGSLAVSLNGAAVTANQVVPHSGTLAATANGCERRDQNLTDTYTGGVSVDYNYSPTSGTATVTSNNLRTVRTDSTSTATEDVTRHGAVSLTLAPSIAGGNTTSDITLSPSNGAILRNEISGVVSTFASGSVHQRLVEITATGVIRRAQLTFDNLSFSVGGVNYLAHGQYEQVYDGSSPTSSGEVVLSRAGTAVARLTISATGVLTVEAGGESRPLY